MDLRVAIIGFGKLGLLHAGLANGLPGSRVVAAVDTSSTVLDALKGYMKDLRIYNDHKAMLADGGIDAVFIATPTGLHVPVAVDCVNAGIPIFIEKPLSLSAEQAQPLMEALERRPVANMVGFMGRHIDTFAKAESLIKSGALGKLQMLRCSMYIGQLFKTGKGWRYDKAQSGGGVLMTQNTHVIDKLLWMFGDLDYVSAQMRSLYSESVEDHAHVFFQFKNGLAGYMDASWSARHYRTPTIQIHVQGENGTLDVDDDHVRVFLDGAAAGCAEGWSQWRKPDLYRPVCFDIGGTQYTLQAEEFLEAVRGRGQVGSTVASALKVQQVVDAAYKSAELGGAPVKLGQ